MSNSKALVVLSGGQDSTTCLFWAIQSFEEVYCLTFDYNQRHKVEIAAARTVAVLAGIPRTTHHEVLELGPILTGSSPLVSDQRLEQYKDGQSLPGGLEKTFVPARNLLFLTIAANRAYTLGCGHIVTGVCQEDYGGYPDCRRDFIDALESTMDIGVFTGEDGAPDGVVLQTPLMYLTKAASIQKAIDLGPKCWTALAYSHTAYDGKYPPIGKDHATLLRAKGFEDHGTPDPLVVKAWGEQVMGLPDTPNYNVVRAYDRDAITMDAILTLVYADITGEGYRP